MSGHGTGDGRGGGSGNGIGDGSGNGAGAVRRGLSESDTRPRPEVVLVTGFPAFTARRMTLKILAEDPQARVYLLSRAKFTDAARELAASLPPDQAARLEVIEGDVCDMDLGLSGPEVRLLAGEVTTIHHMAGIYYMGVDRATARRVNVDGTRGVIELAAEAIRLRRICHWSTAAVSGKRKGVILEEELDEGQAFHNFYEETKFEAERLAQAAQRALPLTILRPGIIVGDSQTGEIDKMDGPYYLLVLIATNATQLKVPLPGRGTAPLHLVPIDFVIDAGYRLSLDERAAGGTFHLTDPNPLPARRVYELVAEHSQGKLARGFLPTGLARALLRAPGLERLTRGPLGFLESFDRPCFYNCRHTVALLEESGIRCPTFDTYVENLVAYVRGVHATRRQKLEDEVFDPFD
ncbi:MAG TPA: SDR family oxidoreductase [Kofleriaceae bacterium]|nr:SDR family oxidoreductase [Kofleriaceae bacterium]